MSAEFQSNSSRPYKENDAEGSDPKKQSRELLDQVLEATLEMTDSDEPMSSEELRPLVAVARRRMNEPLSVETVMELVQTILRLRFRRMIPSAGLWDRMTRQIAETIFEDPRTSERMRQLWDRLCEAAK